MRSHSLSVPVRRDGSRKLELARRRHEAPAAHQWRLAPRNDETLTLANRDGGEYRVKVVVP